MNKSLIASIIENEIEGKNILYPFLLDLTGREKTALSLRDQNKTYEEIGKKLRISRQRAEQLIDKARSKIRFKREIVEMIAGALEKELFSHFEIEDAFIKWDGKPESKIRFQEFLSYLIKEKQL